MDPEALVECPYDKSHRVRGSRLPYHLVKCQRNNPRLARALAACPFNARHRVPQAKLQSHIATCPDKHQPDLPHEVDTSCGNRMKQPEVPTAWQGPPCQEDWEAELEDLEDPPPFILNVGTNDLLLPYESSAPAAPTSRSRGGGAAGHPAAGMEQRVLEGPQTAAAGPGQCPSFPQDWGDRGARGGRAPSAAAAGAQCFQGPHGAPAMLGGEESSEEATGFGAVRVEMETRVSCRLPRPGSLPAPPPPLAPQPPPTPHRPRQAVGTPQG
ncbi:gametocyte-specific factor 1 isoform X2 [Phalacrocorax aristotelis]|uniref:gametocyte-specific factor 1 isoform X2 n=1 Tax=Phalacrocorax aristotelis TaxID=126867 RepID=UPI003F4BCCF4